jgi:Ca-activated chloride channel family protein
MTWEDFMASEILLRAGLRTGMLTGCALALALAGCTKKEEVPAAPAAETTSPAAQGVAVGEPNPATPAAGQKLNTGTPVDGDATVTAPASVGVGAPIEAGWTGPGNSGDYIDLVPRGFTKTSGEITYAYARDAIPVAKMRAPTNPGDYDVRYVVQLAGERKVKATAPITVTAATATLAVPTNAEGGEPMTIAWTGPAGNGDYVDVVPAGHTNTSGEITYAWTKDGNPSTITAPGKAGAYQVRYVLEGPGGRKVLASSPLQVSQPAATLKAPDSAAKGAKVKVEWTGPKRRGDYVDLVKKGQTETSGELSYFYTDRDSSSELTAPAQAGDYEIRYVLEAPGGRQVLANRPVSVR